ncbi:MAG: ArsR family transcriptional regulator [SAR202 cluster bacterium]|nr:ArsR family transcriptional regulator [SAR202 cluster bacterium]MDP6714277.1 ArsR family transcriptional regulator [SAR202 cluster bacterium]
MEGTRFRILQHLQRENQTVGSLANIMELAPATIRRHLDILQRDRLVDFSEVRKKTGRPEYSFRLTEEGQESLPKSYALMLKMMVDELGGLSREDVSDKDGQQVLELVFQRLSVKVADRFSDNTDSLDLDERVHTLLGALDKEHFQPEAENVDGKFQIKLQNCPFRTVALANDAVCEFDASMISTAIGIEMNQVSCISDGQPSCVYQSAELMTIDLKTNSASVR